MTSELNPFITFLGRVVSIVTTQSNSSTIITAEGPITETYPIIYEGILLDADDQFYYLAKVADNISLAIDKTQIVSIEVLEEPKEKDVYTEILDRMNSPEKDEEVN